MTEIEAIMTTWSFLSGIWRKLVGFITISPSDRRLAISLESLCDLRADILPRPPGTIPRLGQPLGGFMIFVVDMVMVDGH